MNDDEPKHIDVKPGNIPVSHTSRPIITGRQQLTHDPMMKPNDDAIITKNEQQTEPVHKEQTIKPSADLVQSQAEKPETPAAVSTESTDTTPADDELPESVVAPSKQEVSPPANDKAADLIANKTYQLPIKQTPARRALTIVVVLLVCAVVAAAVAYFMINR